MSFECDICGGDHVEERCPSKGEAMIDTSGTAYKVRHETRIHHVDGPKGTIVSVYSEHEAEICCEAANDGFVEGRASRDPEVAAKTADVQRLTEQNARLRELVKYLANNLESSKKALICIHDSTSIPMKLDFSTVDDALTRARKEVGE